MKKKAVAVNYNPVNKKDAPKVIAKGEGTTAKKIIEKAEELGIAIHEDPDIVEILSRVNLGDEIPPELYETVAEILVFVYKLNKSI
ncbi:MAG: EscU/YscU/HrcU family type III secretion system export apparatus switch protein [Candidatus Muiribacteriota bacterium]|jgi:FlhB-like protein